MGFAFLFLATSALIACLIIRAFKTGRASHEGVTFVRAKQPFMFWLTLAFYTAMGIIFGLSAFSALNSN